jgi:hypothetical protein
MGNFLTAAYQMRLKQIYTRSIEPKIPRLLKPGELLKNRKRISKLVLPHTGKAYREGIEYAAVDAEARTGQKIKVSDRITAKEKDKLLKEFIVRMINAEAVLNTRLKQHRRLKKLQPGVTKQEDPQKDQFWNEYVNAVKAAANNLIIRAGSEGVRKVQEELT